jgi:hypothetical protein
MFTCTFYGLRTKEWDLPKSINIDKEEGKDLYQQQL